MNITLYVGWEDMWKEQLSLLETHYCSLVEGTGSPSQHPWNRCLLAALSHSARSQLDHYHVVGGPISMFPPWPYLSRAAGMDRGVLHALSPADLYLFTLE